jgi:hypothetical protein
MLKISAYSNAELQGLILGMNGLDRSLRAQLRKQSRTVIAPEWKAAVAARASTKLENRALVATATATVTDTNVYLNSGGKGKLAARFPNVSRAAEFGADRDFRNSYSSNRKGKSYRINKRATQRQLPKFAKTGHVVYPSAANIIPRIAALWVQTTVRELHETIEKR